MTKTKTSKVITTGAGLALLMFLVFTCVGGYDIVKSWFYQPTPEMSTIIDKLELTDLGKRTLYASGPTLEERTNFNEKCDSHNIETYVLGCYAKGEDHIYLYNVDDSDLDGVKESTAAHELLHSVYSRLPFWEKDSVNNELKKYYDTLPDDNSIKETMSLYSENDFYDELHSRLGTEVKELPEKLEAHYQKYFKNQDNIVSFYQKYNEKFKKLEAELIELSEKLASLKTTIETESKNLEKTSSELNSRIINYNSRISSGNYTSYESALSEGRKLESEVNNLTKKYDNLNAKISEYNKLVEKYNDNVIQTNRMMESINSNSSNVQEIK